ncbi:hypothetical protein [Metabacillus halosaccharovorans]|uniref:hypothetical protein n=1 Tax=Metabacillus halosaccharovorans TaxID=930124 RepID=UPI003735AD25
MKPSEYLAILNEIEMNYPVKDWRSQGVRIWPIIRLSLAMKLHQQSESNSLPSGSKKNKIQFLKKDYIKPFLEGKKYANPPIVKSDVVFLTHSLFKTEIQDKWYDRFIDPLIYQLKDLKKDGYILEYSSKDVYRSHTFHPSKMIQFKLNLLRIKTKILNRFKQPKISFNSFDEVNSVLKKHGISMNSSISYVKYLALIIEMSKYFEDILTKSQAKVGMTVYYYGPEGMAFNLACDRLGIPSIDIQHGVQGRYHRAYGSWSNVPSTGYELLPKKFWCWSEQDIKSINSWANGTVHEAFIGGNPWLEIWKSSNEHISFIKEYKMQAKELIDANKKDKVILVTLQTGRDIPSLLIDIMNKGDRSWLWLIRLHPHMLEQYSSIVDKLSKFVDFKVSYNIDFATELPLYAILPFTDLHITEWSSAVIESREFGVKSILLHEFGKELFKKEIESEVAYFSQVDEDIVRKIPLLMMEKSNHDDLTTLKSMNVLSHYLE